MHVMRAFEDADVIHVEDRVDPVQDIDIITSELRIKDLEYMVRLFAHSVPVCLCVTLWWSHHQ